MKKLIVFTMMLILIAGGGFKSGCSREAKAANVMLTQTSCFTIITNIVVTNLNPAAGSTGVSMNASISMDVKHELPIVSTELIVKADGEVILGSLVVTNNLMGGKHILWTPDNDYPMFSNISWILNVEVNNGN